jgi:hypothetical protein
MSTIQHNDRSTDASHLVVRKVMPSAIHLEEKKSMAECLAVAAEIRLQLANREHSDSTGEIAEDRQR